MEDLHALSIKLLDLLQQYENGVKENMSFEQAKELRNKILELQSTLQKQKEVAKTE